jgi:hypothetical protein
MSVPRSQLRLHQITSSLPDSSGAALTTVDHSSLKSTIDALASSVRRLNSYDETGVGFYADAQVFKSMGNENRFVLLNNQKLFVSSSTLLSGTTEISTAAGAFSVSGSNAATIDVGGQFNVTGSSVRLKSRSGNFEFDSADGTSFIEDGTEVFSINASRKTKFHTNAGTLASPDVEFDGKVRFDSDMASSGSLSFAKAASQYIEKNNSGHLIISSSVGSIYTVDNNVEASTWTEKALGIPFSSAASDWSNLQAAGVTSILNGILAGSTASKYKVALGADLDSGVSTSLNMNFSSLTQAQVDSRVDVFVNGQLMFSGSAANVTSGNADYRLDYASGASDVEVKFSEKLHTEDIIQVVIR